MAANDVTLGREIALDPKARKRLQADDPKLLAEIDQRRTQAKRIRYPQPTEGDVRSTVERLRNSRTNQMEIIDEVRELRYGRDTMDEKFARHLEGDPERIRVHSNLTGNEILRVVAMIDRNGLTVNSPVSNDTNAASDAAEARKRWGQEFFPAMDRKAGRKLGRLVLDSAVAYGAGAWELYRTGSYDKLEGDLKQQEGETDAQYKKRTDQLLQNADCPYGLRAINARKLLYEVDDMGVCRVVIIEWKQYRQVYADTFEKYGSEKVVELRWPQPGDQGWASALSSRAGSFVDVTTTEPLVETWRVYDRCWYTYVVAGSVVDGPVEHKFNRIPVFIVEGMTTSDDGDGESVQGITFGIRSVERALNDELTTAHDVKQTYGRPKIAVELAVNGAPFLDPRTKLPARIDFSDPRRAPQLPPGAKAVNVNAGFQPEVDQALIGTFTNLFQRSGMNPVAQGASPGADPAGYTVATLISQVNDEYNVVLSNYARAAGELLDCCAYDIRENLGDKVFLPVQGTGDARGRVEWLGLGPDQAEPVPFRVSVDPSSEQNRLARVQTLTGGWKDGVVPRRKLQIDGYGSEDPDEWDNLIIEDMAMQQLVPIVVQYAMKEWMAGAMPDAYQSMQPGAAGPSSGLVDQNGNPISSQQQVGQPGAPGPVDALHPAPPQGSTVGPEAAAASQGNPNGAGNATRMNPSRATAGQNRGVPSQQAAGARQP